MNLIRLTLILSAGVLVSGCITAVPYKPNDRLLEGGGFEKAKESLSKLLSQSVKPSIDYNSIEITKSHMKYTLQGLFGPSVVQDDWDRVGSVRIHNVSSSQSGGRGSFDDSQATHDTMILDGEGNEIRSFRFLGLRTAQRFADLVMSFRRSSR